MIDIYITHHVRPDLHGATGMLMDALEYLRRSVPTDQARVVVVWSHAGGDDFRTTTAADLKALLRSYVVVENDRSGRPDSQPSIRNKVVDLARSSGCEAFVLLHNDVRPAKGWFQHLIGDWRDAEARWGRDRCVVTPRYIPYHTASAFLLADRPVSIIALERMREWLDHVEDAQIDGNGDVVCPSRSRVTDDGHQLMMFCASPRFFDSVGECDERYLGLNYDDCDWGIRALLASKKNLQSTGALVGHVGGFTFFASDTPQEKQAGFGTDNARLFIEKWGRPMFDEMQTGQLWRRLHREQGMP